MRVLSLAAILSSAGLVFAQGGPRNNNKADLFEGLRAACPVAASDCNLPDFAEFVSEPRPSKEDFQAAKELARDAFDCLKDLQSAPESDECAAALELLSEAKRGGRGGGRDRPSRRSGPGNRRDQFGKLEDVCPVEAAACGLPDFDDMMESNEKLSREDMEARKEEAKEAIECLKEWGMEPSSDDCAVALDFLRNHDHKPKPYGRRRGGHKEKLQRLADVCPAEAEECGLPDFEAIMASADDVDDVDMSALKDQAKAAFECLKDVQVDESTTDECVAALERLQQAKGGRGGRKGRGFGQRKEKLKQPGERAFRAGGGGQEDGVQGRRSRRFGGRS